MTIPQPIALPPGFENLTKVQQIDYVQQLWDMILATSDEVPVPEWHLEIVRDRIASQDTTQLSNWNEAKQRLMSEYCEQ